MHRPVLQFVKSYCFEMPNLQIVILDKNKNYEETEHYKQFSIDDKQNQGLNRGNKNI